MMRDLSGLGTMIANIIFIGVAVIVIVFVSIALLKWLFRFKEAS